MSIIFSRICWQTGDPRPIFAPKGLDLSWMLLLYQIIITITCWHQLFQITSFNQFTSLLALNCSCPNFFWNVLQVWMTGKDVYLQMTWSWPDKTWNICVHIVCNEIQVKVNLEITTFFFYLRFPYCPNFFWFGVVQSPSFRQAQFALIGQLTQCIVIGRTPQALVGNVTPLSIIVSFSFQNECKDR